jgi:hypothetical protein
MSIVEYFGRKSRDAVDSYARRPVYRSWWFGIPLAICVVDTLYDIWILAEYWSKLTSDARFWLMFLGVTTTLALAMTYSQHRIVREADVTHKLGYRLSVTTIFIVSWLYFLLGIALHLIVHFVRHG